MSKMCIPSPSTNVPKAVFWYEPSFLNRRSKTKHSEKIGFYDLLIWISEFQNRQDVDLTLPNKFPIDSISIECFIFKLETETGDWKSECLKKSIFIDFWSKFRNSQKMYHIPLNKLPDMGILIRCLVFKLETVKARCLGKIDIYCIYRFLIKISE